MVSKDFLRQLEGYGITTANILYRMPDIPRSSSRSSGSNTICSPNFPSCANS